MSILERRTDKRKVLGSNPTRSVSILRQFVCKNYCGIQIYGVPCNLCGLFPKFMSDTNKWRRSSILDIFWDKILKLNYRKLNVFLVTLNNIVKLIR